MEEKEKILKGKFRYSGKYVYCGKKVHAKPIEITENKAVMEYSRGAANKKAYLALYPFKKGELKKLLKKTRFRKITQYSDYKKGFNPKADFYTYVCKK